MKPSVEGVARIVFIAWAACTLLQAGCGNDPEGMVELREQQRQILARLEAIEKKIDQRAAGEPARRSRRGPSPDAKHEIPAGNSPARGPENAPVTIVEFSDYQCPSCARSESLISQVLQEHGDKVRFVYKHFPLESIHPHALPAALAAAAAQLQGRFWEMHELLFANQRALEPERIQAYAREAGLDAQRFETDLRSPEVRGLVRADMRLAQRLGVRGTPTIFVNGKLLRDRSPDGLRKTIDSLLAVTPPG